MNRVIHFEVHAKDKDGVQKFYQELFGWEFQMMGPEYGNYRVIKTGDMLPTDMASVGINGGVAERKGEPGAVGAPVNAFVCVVGVQDTDAMVTKAVELGGQIAVEAMEVPMVGRLAYLLDPENNIFGVLTPSRT